MLQKNLRIRTVHSVLLDACYEIFYSFLKRNLVKLDWKDLLVLVKVPPWVSPCLVPEKKQFGIWVFLEVQERNFLVPLKVNINIVYFYIGFFHFTKKFLLVLTMHAFFSKYFTTLHPLQPKFYFYWFLLVVI